MGHRDTLQMGISLCTARQIQVNKTFVASYFHESSGKHGYTVTLGEEKYFRSLVSMSPIYDSKDAALVAGDALVTSIRETDLGAQLKASAMLVEGEAASTIDAIVQAAKK